MKRSKPKSRGADDSGALAEAELTALEADISQLQVGRHPLSCPVYIFPARRLFILHQALVRPVTVRLPSQHSFEVER